MKQTYSAFFREKREVYTFDEIVQNFGIGLYSESEAEIKDAKDSLKKALEKLQKCRIAKYGKAEQLGTKDINDDELKEQEEKEEIDLNDNDDSDDADGSKSTNQKNVKGYNFNFVGIISFSNFIFYFYPKYIDTQIDADGKKEKFLRPSKADYDINIEKINKYNESIEKIEKHFKTVMHVIKCFSKENFIQPLSFVNCPTDKKIDTVSFLVFMLQQFFETGLYYREETYVETNGDGEIDWERVINETTPIIQNNVPYYVELKTIQKREDETNLLRKLHMAILSECSARLEKMGILKYLGISPVYFEYNKVSSFGDRQVLERLINKELCVQNANLQKIQLYNMLYYITEENDSKLRSNSLNVYGKKNFETIWEKVCKALFDDLYNNDYHFYYNLSKKTSSLESISKALKEKDKNVKQSILDKLIPEKEDLSYFLGKTSWDGVDDKDKDKLEPLVGGSSLIPDIVSIWNNRLLILDAKYYCIETEADNSIINKPGATDISKQFEYEMLFKKGFEGAGFEDFVNMFLTPMTYNLLTGAKETILKRDYLADYCFLRKSFGLPDFRKIRIISLNPHICFEKFLAKESLLTNAQALKDEIEDVSFCKISEDSLKTNVNNQKIL